MTLRQRLQALHNWIYHTGAIVFYPVILLAILSAIQTLTLTATCNVAGLGCPYAISSDKLVAMYAGAMMSLNGSDEYVPTDKRKALR